MVGMLRHMGGGGGGSEEDSLQLKQWVGYLHPSYLQNRLRSLLFENIKYRFISAAIVSISILAYFSNEISIYLKKKNWTYLETVNFINPSL